MQPEGWGSVLCSVEGQPPEGQDFNPVLRKEAVIGTDPCTSSTICSLSCSAQHKDQPQALRGLRRAREGHTITWNPIKTDCARQLTRKLWKIKAWITSSPDPFHWLRTSSLQTQLLHLTNYYMLSFCPLPSHHMLFLITLIPQIAKSSGKVKHIKIVELFILCFVWC